MIWKITPKKNYESLIFSKQIALADQSSDYWNKNRKHCFIFALKEESTDGLMEQLV